MKWLSFVLLPPVTLALDPSGHEVMMKMDEDAFVNEGVEVNVDEEEISFFVSHDGRLRNDDSFHSLDSSWSFERSSIKLEANLPGRKVTDEFSILDAGVFYEYEVINLKATPPATPTQITKFGIQVPMEACVRNCSGVAPEIIRLEGTVLSELVVGTSLPPATRIGGLFTMQGSWSEAFQIPILQISNVVAGASFDLSKPFPASPSSLTLGASICLGSTTACADLDVSAKDFISAAAYIGIDAAVPQNNYLLAMVSSFTVENILRVAAVIDPGLNSGLIDGLPSSILDSGITPPDSAVACDSLGNKTAQALGEESLNLDCYAYVALSPFSTNTIESINLEIPRGISFAGKLNLFDLYQVQVDAKIDVIDTTNPSFYLFAQLNKITMKDFLEIGGSVNSDTSHVEGDAKFLIDYQTVGVDGVLSLLVNVEAAIAIPVLKTYGEVDISVTDDGASLEGKIFFLGGLLEPTVIVRWDWEFTYFYAELGDIKFIPYVLELNQLILDVDAREDDFALLFSIDIAVLSFADLGAELRIEERTNPNSLDKDLWVQFDVTAELQLVNARVKGEATLDLDDLSNTEFGEFDVTVTAGAVVTAIVDFVNDAVDALKEGFNTAIAAVGEAIEAIGNYVNSIVDKLDFLVDAWNDFTGAVDALFSGDFLAAGRLLGSAFETAFSAEAWEKVGEVILNGLEDAGLAINDTLGLSSKSSTVTVETSSQKDKWKCFLLRQKTVTRRCWDFGFFGKTCDDDVNCSDPFSDSACVQQKMDLLAETRAKTATASTYGQGGLSAEEGNAAILNANRGEFPQPEFDDIQGKVKHNKDGSSSILKATIGGKTKTLDNAAAGGHSSGATAFSTSDEVEINLTPSDRRRLQEGGSLSVSQEFLDSVSLAFEDAEKAIYMTANKDMTGLDSRIKQFGGNPLEPLEIAFLASDLTVTVSCSDLIAAATRKPKITSSDPDCGSNTFLTSTKAMTYRRTSSSFKVPASFSCGTVKVTREYTVKDKCDQSDSDTQSIYLEPEAPEFTSVPEQTAEKTYSTSVESLSPNSQGGNWPLASSVCGHAVKIDSSDAIPQAVAEQCGFWVVSRIWDAYLVFGDEVETYCAEKGNPSPPTAQAIQQFNIQDDEAPRYIEDVVAAEVRIPFFNNYNSTRLNAPLIKDIPTNVQAHDWGLFVGEETLTSKDFGFEFAPTGPLHEEGCRDRGIAHFYRQFTAADKCGNSKTFTQKVIIEHPPESLTPTTPLVDGKYSYSPGVEQSQDACVAGKDVTLGDKSYAADFDFTDESNVCVEDAAWNENGCRLQTSAATDVYEILSVKPEFVTFPPDATVNTKESISPDALGTPSGTAFCSTPFEIVHADDAATLVKCGVWEIVRRWTIRPVYDGCEAVTDQRLATERVQVITVKDIFAPEFISLPETQVDVPFLDDYGPNNADVSFPQVQEQVYHPTLVAHAALHNTAKSFLFVSYPTTLFYNDQVEFRLSSTEVCASGSLADVTRTWTTYDRCGTTATWVQTIHITKPTEKLFADASGYQIASPEGSIQLRKSDVSQKVLSKGDLFGMWDSTIYCSTADFDEAEAALVLDSCPQHKMGASYVPDGPIMYQEIPGEKCNAFKGQDSAVPIVVPADDFPVDFSAAGAAITEIATLVTGGPSGLLTGPQKINCTTPDSISCFDVAMSPPIVPIPVTADPNSGALFLTGGIHRVYNSFVVDMGTWFYNSSDAAFATPAILITPAVIPDSVAPTAPAPTTAAPTTTPATPATTSNGNGNGNGKNKGKGNLSIFT